MDKSLKAKFTNVLAHEAEYILKHEEDVERKLSNMNTIFNLQKILDNYDELEPLLIEFFDKKAKIDKWHCSKNELERGDDAK